MFRRAILSVLGLGVVATAPVIYYTAPEHWKAVRNEWFPPQEMTALEGAGRTGLPDASQEDPAAGAPLLALEGASTHDLAEVLRFDVTTGWVLRGWPRVSTGLAQLQLQGYRVPLVTGTAETDLAGSLTYYFNPQQKVQQITFSGTTGNTRKLVTFLTTRYNFTRRLTNDPGLFVYEVVDPNGRPRGILTIRSARVVKSSDPYRRFEVELVMARPS